MIGDFLINGESAFKHYGVRPHDGFYDAFLAPRTKKPFVTSKSRMEHGTRVIISNSRFEERDITINVTISGKTREEFQAKKKKFFDLLEGDNLITFKLQGIDDDSVYRLYYKSGASYTFSPDGTFCSVALKMCEPNPGDRN